MLPRTLIAALVLYLLAVIGAAIAPVSTKPFATPNPAAVPHSSPTVLPDPLIGFALNFHHTQDLSLYLKAVDEIAALGFNSVEIVTPAFQENGASENIRIEYGPGFSPTREDLVELLLYARSKGLSTTLMPIVLFTKPRGNEWRGKISPEQWGPWWESYQQIINYFVTIAIESDVQMFSIGSELLTTETNFEQWQRLIKHVRSRYQGKLIYSTNWDHYHIPTFWSQLDYIGVSGYWDMTTLSPKDNPADPDAMAKRWIEIRSRLMAFSSVQKRPVIMTEVGYPSLPWALKSPWNYVAAGPRAKADPLAQAAGYRAFLSAWEDLVPPPASRLPVRLDQNETPELTPPLTPELTPGQSPAVDSSPTRAPSLAAYAEPDASEADSPASATQPAGSELTVLPNQPSLSNLNDFNSPTNLTNPTNPAEPITSTSPTPTRREGFMGFYFYAWDVYQQGGPKDTGYGVRNKPAYDVIKNFMQYHGFKPVTPPDTFDIHTSPKPQPQP